MGNYGAMVDAVMAGWYPLCFALFMLLPPARAVAVGLVLGFLLLPNVVYDLPGMPNYDKGLALVLGIGHGFAEPVLQALHDCGRHAFRAGDSACGIRDHARHAELRRGRHVR